MGFHSQNTEENIDEEELMAGEKLEISKNKV